MATAQVKALNEATKKRVIVLDLRGRPRWSEVFENNPRIVMSCRPDVERLVNAGGARPYIAGKTLKQWTWKPWERLPGEIWLSEAERAFALPFAGRILVEPNTKEPNGNKAWPFDRWQSLVNRKPDHFIQVGAPNTRALSGVLCVETTFRQALAILAVSKAFVGTEGALHHAAAALSVPAVVLWSEFIAPEFTGYEGQVNIRHATKWCGSRMPCPGCRASMDAIQVDEVASALEGVL